MEDDQRGVSDSLLVPEATGYYSGFVPNAEAGTRYRFRLDGGDAFPDPVSRFQPDGPHGPSVVIDPRQYQWGDAAHKGNSQRLRRTGDIER
jgi:maltooligosyltrehalose trehalohydrolase